MGYKPGEKKEEKTTKYGPLRWELKQKYQEDKVKQYNIIMGRIRGMVPRLRSRVEEVGRK